MRKFVSLLIILCILSTSFSVFSDESTESIAPNVNDAVLLLHALGALDSSEIVASDLKDEITRGQFIQYLNDALGMSIDINTENNYFADTADSWALPYIENFVRLGAVLGYSDSDRVFRPDDGILLSEALTILLRLTGYDTLAEYKGGFPAGYIAVAKKVKIIDSDFKSNGVLTKEQAFLLIYNALNISMYEPSSFTMTESGLEQHQTNDNEKSLLSVYRNIYYAEGIVTAADGVTFTESATDSDGYLVVNGINYKIKDDKYYEKYIGKDVDLYYYSINDDDKGDVVCIIERDNGSYCVDIDASLVKKLDEDYELTYYKDEKNSKILRKHLERSAVVIYNGAEVKKSIREVFSNLHNGFVRLVDMDHDGDYEYVFIKDYEDIVVRLYDTGTETLYDKLSGKDFDIDDVLVSNFCYADYTKANPESLVENTIVSVAYTPGVYFEGIISTDKLTGVISSQSVNKDVKSIVIDGKTYEIARCYENMFPQNTFIGAEANVYFNVFGDVCYISAGDSTDMKFGFLRKMDYSTKTLEEKLLFKLFTLDGKTEIFTLADNVKVDGVKKSTVASIVRAISGCTYESDGTVTTYPQGIRYKLNSDGNISAIDTVTYIEGSEYESNSLFKTNYIDNYRDGGARIYPINIGTNLRRIGMNIVLNSETKIMRVPPIDAIINDEDEDYQYGFGSIADDLEDSVMRDGKCEAYHYDLLGGFEDVLVIYDNGINEWNKRTKAFAVEGVSDAANDEYGTLKKISGFFGGVKTSLFVAPEINMYDGQYDEGDILAISLDSRNFITDIHIVYDYSQGGEPYDQSGSEWATQNAYVNVPGSTFYQTNQYSFMYPAFKNSNVVKFVYDKTNSDYLINYDEAFDVGKYPIVIFDKELRGDKLYSGTVNDIRDINSVGIDACSKVFVHYRGRVITDIIVYI